jgi:hypothetical protein
VTETDANRSSCNEAVPFSNGSDTRSAGDIEQEYAFRVSSRLTVEVDDPEGNVHCRTRPDGGQRIVDDLRGPFLRNNSFIAKLLRA